MMTRRILAFAAVCLMTTAQAQETDDPWSGKATLGFLATSGNTENSNLNSGIEVKYTTDNWEHGLNAVAINATENNATTAEAYEAGWKSERRVSENNYVFGMLDWRKDRFSSYESQFSQTVGIGRRMIDREKHKLDAEVGGGARQSELQDGTREDEFVAVAAANYLWILSDSANFRQAISAEAGDENTYLESKSALSAKLVGNLALVASYTVKHNTDVLPGTERTDTYTALSLEYVW